MRAHKKTECSLSKRASALEPGPQGLGQGLSQKGPGQEGQEGTGHSCILLDIASLGPLPKKAGVNGFCISPLSGKG